MRGEFMYTYQTSPIDFFEASPTFEDFLRLRIADEANNDVSNCLIRLMQCAREISLQKGFCWEGDAHDLRVFGLPDPDSHQMDYGVVWKQGNNGTTFICSPFELPWLREGEG
jgi:hypothetical protein